MQKKYRCSFNFILFFFYIFVTVIFSQTRTGSGIKSIRLPQGFRSNIRVLLEPKTRSCSLFSLGAVYVKSGNYSARWKGSINVQIRKNSIYLTCATGKGYLTDKAVVISSVNKYNSIEVNKNEYRGMIRIVLLASDGFMVINELDIEDYLKGVLPLEIGIHGRENLEALKAQAVTARTYTIKRLLDRPREMLFDVYSDVSDQVYRGRSGEYLMACRAIRDTKGIVAVYGDSLANCYYSSTCGGKTANIEEVWLKTYQPYLRSVEDKDEKDYFCRKSKYFNWTLEWSYNELNSIIKKFLPLVDASAGKCGNLKNIKIVERTSSGRVARLRIKTEKGTYIVKGDKVRWVLRRNENNYPILYSSFFKISSKPLIGKTRKYVATGHGWGHGVGMCQMGALGMSEKGYTCEAILKHYYKGIKLVRLNY